MSAWVSAQLPGPRSSQKTGVRTGPVPRPAHPGESDGSWPDVYLSASGLEFEVSQSWACLTGTGLRLHAILSDQCCACWITMLENLSSVITKLRLHWCCFDRAVLSKYLKNGLIMWLTLYGLYLNAFTVLWKSPGALIWNMMVYSSSLSPACTRFTRLSEREAMRKMHIKGAVHPKMEMKSLQICVLFSWNNFFFFFKNHLFSHDCD